jgi:hypothetical protein
MVVRVKLEGLKIYKARGRWYVYPRGGGDPLIKGFDGSRDEVLKKLAEPEFMQTYNRPRLQKRLAASFPIETLGGFIHWYTNGDIDRPPKERKGAPARSRAAIRNGQHSRMLRARTTSKHSNICGQSSIWS